MADRAPHNLTDVFGMTYSQFTRPNGHVSVEFAGTLAKTASSDAQALIELLNADADTEVLAAYGHYAWKDYAAVTRHAFGKGDAEWIATLLDADTIRAVMREAVEHAGHRRCRNRARRTDVGASRSERPRRERDVSAQLFRRRGHRCKPGVQVKWWSLRS